MATPTWLKDMQAWIQSGGKLGMYDRAGHAASNEGGVDLTAPEGTPVYAIATGPLESAQTFASQGQAHYGAVLSQMVNVPGVGLENIYYQHINLLPGIEKCLGGNCGGTIIQKGQEIGTVGSIGETEVGFNAASGWGSLYGPTPTPGPWPDKPESWIAALMGADGSLSDGTSYTTTTDATAGGNQCPWYCALTPFATWGPCAGCTAPSTGSGQVDNAMAGINNALGNITQGSWWARVGVILLGGILILVGAWKLMK